MDFRVEAMRLGSGVRMIPAEFPVNSIILVG